LHFLLERSLFLFYPIIPQITTTIAEEKGINLLTSSWPEYADVTVNSDLVQKIIDFNSEVWRIKKEKGISLRDSISGIEIPSEIKDFEKDLVSCHGLI
jgi:valyl-tRNA synthetase